MEVTERRERRARELRVATGDLAHLSPEERGDVIAYRVQRELTATARRLSALIELARDFQPTDAGHRMLEAGEDAERQAFTDVCYQLDELGFGPRF